jgi:hypothetical protein
LVYLPFNLKLNASCKATHLAEENPPNPSEIVSFGSLNFCCYGKPIHYFSAIKEANKRFLPSSGVWSCCLLILHKVIRFMWVVGNNLLCSSSGSFIFLAHFLKKISQLIFNPCTPICGVTVVQNCG